MSGYRGRRSSPPRPARWMDLRYAGVCHVCRGELAAGARGFYDPDGRTVTCTAIACASADGLTEQRWYGAPTSGRFVEVLAGRRIGRKAAPTDIDGTPIAYVSVGGGRRAWRRGYSATGHRCIDAPCCGCCD
jgi:hypothetical protein